MLKLPVSCILTVPLILSLPAFISENFVYGVTAPEAFYAFFALQVLLYSIPSLRIISFLGWALLSLDFWLGFCWILSHLLARALHQKQSYACHPIILLCGLGLPFLIQTFNTQAQCIIYFMSLFLLTLDNIRSYPLIGLASFVIPWIPLFLGNPVYKPSPLYTKIEQMFQPQRSLIKPMSPQFFKHLATVSHQPLHLSSGVPTSILVPLAQTSLQRTEANKIQFSHHFRTIHPVLSKHYPLYFIIRDGQTDLFLGFHSLLDFLMLADSTGFNLHSSSSPPPAAVIFSQVFSSYDVLSHRWPDHFSPKFDLALNQRRQGIPLEIAHRTFDKGIWYQLGKDAALRPALTKPDFYKDGIRWMLMHQQFEVAEHLIFQLEQINYIDIDILLLKAQSALAQGQYRHALHYALQYHQKSAKADQLLYELLQKIENQFIHYGQNFPYQILLDLSRLLYEASGRMQQNLLFDSLRYQKQIMPRPSYDPAGCMDCAKKNLLKQRSEAQLKSHSLNHEQSKKDHQSP